ncbi:MAG: hypothetical protein AB7I38_11090 [Dehalococcoidia bacterium]
MTEIRTQGDLDRAHASLVALQDFGVRLYRGACRPPCGVRRRGWPERVEDAELRVWAPHAASLFESLIGVDMHIEVPDGLAFDGAPIGISDDGRMVAFSVVEGTRTCTAVNCGHPEREHYVAPDSFDGFRWWCRQCKADLDGLAQITAQHEPECAPAERGEPL